MKIKFDPEKHILDTIRRGETGLNWIFIQLDKSQNEKPIEKEKNAVIKK